MFPLNWNIPFIRKNGSRTTLGAITGDIAGIEEDVAKKQPKDVYFSSGTFSLFDILSNHTTYPAGKRYMGANTRFTDGSASTVASLLGIGTCLVTIDKSNEWYQKIEFVGGKYAVGFGNENSTSVKFTVIDGATNTVSEVQISKAQ